MREESVTEGKSSQQRFDAKSPSLEILTKTISSVNLTQFLQLNARFPLKKKITNQQIMTL